MTHPQDRAALAAEAKRLALEYAARASLHRGSPTESTNQAVVDACKAVHDCIDRLAALAAAPAPAEPPVDHLRPPGGEKWDDERYVSFGLTADHVCRMWARYVDQTNPPPAHIARLISGVTAVVVAALSAPAQQPAQPAEPVFVQLRAMGALDADNNLDCWDTPPFDVIHRHVKALNEGDPASCWRVEPLYIRAGTTAAPSPQQPAQPAEPPHPRCDSPAICAHTRQCAGQYGTKRQCAELPASPAAQQVAAAVPASNFVQPVPDHCDRIVWRNRYYHLGNMRADTPAAAGGQALTDAQIEAGWRATFSTDNPYCPCNLKSFTKAVRWTEAALTQRTEQKP